MLTVAPTRAQAASDADGEGPGGPSSSAQLTKQPSGGASSKPGRRRRAGQPPAAVELPEEPDMEPATTRKRHKRRGGVPLAPSLTVFLPDSVTVWLVMNRETMLQTGSLYRTVSWLPSHTSLTM